MKPAKVVVDMMALKDLASRRKPCKQCDNVFFVPLGKHLAKKIYCSVRCGLAAAAAKAATKRAAIKKANQEYYK